MSRSLRRGLTFGIAVLGLAPSLSSGIAPGLQGTLLCLPERAWVCNGLGECSIIERPDTLAAWKIDTVAKTYSLCKRNGMECALIGSLSAVDRNLEWIAAFSGGLIKPKTFVIDHQTAKFVAISITQPTGVINTTKGILERDPDLSAFSIDNTSGSCVAVR